LLTYGLVVVVLALAVEHLTAPIRQARRLELNFDKIQEGMTRVQVEDILGTPDFEIRYDSNASVGIGYQAPRGVLGGARYHFVVNVGARDNKVRGKYMTEVREGLHAPPRASGR
jgi:hypothetical protein